MAFRAKLLGSSGDGCKEVYIPPEKLPEGVAFSVKKVYSHINKSKKDGSKSNCAILKYKPFLDIKFYADQNFQDLSADELKEFQTAIETSEEKWYGVSDGPVGTYVVTKLISENQLNESSYVQFDEKVHVIKADNSSPLKRHSSSDLGGETSKKKKE